MLFSGSEHEIFICIYSRTCVSIICHKSLWTISPHPQLAPPRGALAESGDAGIFQSCSKDHCEEKGELLLCVSQIVYKISHVANDTHGRSWNSSPVFFFWAGYWHIWLLSLQTNQILYDFPRTMCSPDLGQGEAWSVKVFRATRGILGALKFFIRWSKLLAGTTQPSLNINWRVSMWKKN